MRNTRVSLQLWPGVVIVAAQWTMRFGLPVVWPDALPYGIMAGVAGGLAVWLWWLCFSRAPRRERWGASVLLIVLFAATMPLLDRSIATGMMGMMFAIYAVPALSLALVLWAAVSRPLSPTGRCVSLAVMLIAASGGWTLVRTDGITGDAASAFAWRWTPTREARLVKAETPPEAGLPMSPAPPSENRADPEPAIMAAVSSRPNLVSEKASIWAGFRGPERDGTLAGVRIQTDWTAFPPVELWRRAIGPGWSSFAVEGNRLYTQEQRGEEELVSCYDATTGNPLWAHRDAARFWESNAGPGPRGTPALRDGRVYAFGATGILNALDARNGAVIWSRNPASELARKIPGWGFSSSPLMVNDLVIVAVGGQLAAYDAGSGERRWTAPPGGASYSSPHLMKAGGVEQVLLMSETGATSVAPEDGRVIWKHSWPGNVRIVQPGITEDGDVLLEGGESTGMRRLAVAKDGDGWKVEERWTSTGLKPYFNDFVVHDGHAYGFDGSILACIDVRDGKRKWKGGRYGHGQVVLLREQGVLLVLSEEGELALVQARSDQFAPLARIPAMEGKTWNHPVLTGDRLVVRNAEEMVAFRLALAPR